MLASAREWPAKVKTSHGQPKGCTQVKCDNRSKHLAPAHLVPKLPLGNERQRPSADRTETVESDAGTSRPVQTALDKLISRTDDYAVSYAESDACRTSNQIDRPMNRITRRLYASRGLHGHQATSERRLRAICLLENFRPFAPRSNTPREHYRPAHRFNDKAYDPNWLRLLSQRRWMWPPSLFCSAS